VGCAASFDPRAQRAVRATAQLLKRAAVNFAVLGTTERCTGDPARRMGDEFLFQQCARTNIASLSEHQVRKIVTPCPHCFNTLRNEYGQFGGEYHVLHHSQLLAELIAAGRLPPVEAADGVLTLHDPCYLARVNGETTAPRQVLKSGIGSAEYQDMPRHGSKTFCCGAGGGRIFFDESPDQRPSRQRADEAIATGASTVATACPFCLNMLRDGVASVAGGEVVSVMDIAEVLIQGYERPLG
jgi:Fe-S oxidoreductase